MNNHQFITFHRYYVWANRLRTDFDKTFEGAVSAPENIAVWFADSPGLFMSYWYSALYVVIEGWRELHAQDAEIDSLLASGNVDYLRKFRNGVFHFQQDYFDNRFLGLMTSADSVDWVRSLNRAFGRWFLEEYARRRPHPESEV